MYARLTNPSARELLVLVAFRYQNRLIVHSESTQTVVGFVLKLTRMVIFCCFGGVWFKTKIITGNQVIQLLNL